MINWNYHTHTLRCHHASGQPLDYAKEAFEAGIRQLGFSDHIPHPDGRWGHTRMTMAELDAYESDVAEAAERYPEMRVRTGYECEWYPEVRDYYKEEILSRPNVDYLIGGEHWFPWKGEWRDLTALETPAHLASYADNLMEAMESGLFLFIAHPDMFGLGWYEWDENAAACARDLCRTAVKTDTLLEINSYGCRKAQVVRNGKQQRPYPWFPFWEIAASEGVTATTNSDAHRPEDIAANIKDTMDLANKLSIKVVNPWEYANGR